MSITFFIIFCFFPVFYLLQAGKSSTSFTAIINCVPDLRRNLESDCTFPDICGDPGKFLIQRCLNNGEKQCLIFVSGQGGERRQCCTRGEYDLFQSSRSPMAPSTLPLQSCLCQDPQRLQYPPTVPVIMVLVHPPPQHPPPVCRCVPASADCFHKITHVPE